MASRVITINAKRAKRGERMTGGNGYRLITKRGKMFAGSLIDTINVGKYRLAIFSVPKGR
jgi:hypothetical protein